MNKEIITIETIPEVIDWGNMQFQLDDKTILHYIEIIDYNYGEIGDNLEGEEMNNETPSIFELSVTFYDCHYFTKIYWNDILDNFNQNFSEGPSILFSSFEDHISIEHWDLIKELIKKLVNEQNN